MQNIWDQDTPPDFSFLLPRGKTLTNSRPLAIKRGGPKDNGDVFLNLPFIRSAESDLHHEVWMPESEPLEDVYHATHGQPYQAEIDQISYAANSVVYGDGFGRDEYRITPLTYQSMPHGLKNAGEYRNNLFERGELSENKEHKCTT